MFQCMEFTQAGPNHNSIWQLFLFVYLFVYSLGFHLIVYQNSFLSFVMAYCSIQLMHQEISDFLLLGNYIALIFPNQNKIVMNKATKMFF